MKVVTLLRGNEYLDSARSPTGLRRCAAHLRRTIFLALAGSRGGNKKLHDPRCESLQPHPMYEKSNVLVDV